MTERISIAGLRKRAETEMAHFNGATVVPRSELLALVEIAEAANRYCDSLGEDEDAEMRDYNAIVDAVDRFDFTPDQQTNN